MKPAWFILIALVLLHHDFWFFAVKKLWPAFASTSVQPSVESAEATGGPAS